MEKAIVQLSDFTGILSLGLNVGTGTPSLTRTADEAWAQSLIDTYLPDYLRGILGYQMTESFLAWAGADVREDNEVFVKLLDLITNEHPNPAACYIYFKALDNGNVRASSTGVHRTADDGAENPRGLQIRAWNAMVDGNRRILLKTGEDETFNGVTLNPRLGFLETLNWFGI